MNTSGFESESSYDQKLGTPATENHQRDRVEFDLEEVISNFQEIRSELHYQEARDVLKNLVTKLDLTDRERSGLDAEIQSLDLMLNKLDQMVIQIAVFGMVGRGKSSVLNALLGQAVFEMGPTHGVTQTIQSVSWHQMQHEVMDTSLSPLSPLSPGSNSSALHQDVVRVALRGLGNSQVQLIDTPGIDEVDGEMREQLAQQIVRRSDLILFVISGDLTRVEHEALERLCRSNKPILLVFNKIDQYSASERKEIYQKLSERLQGLLSVDEIVMTAASPLVTRAVRRADGAIAKTLERGDPDVKALKLKILDVLSREGKSLVALNTMLYADEVNEKVVQRKMEIRDRSANQVIWNAVMTKAMAIAINPITVIDLVSSAIVDVVMILALSKLYGIAMTQQDAVGLLQKIMIGMGGITISELVTVLGLGSLKSLLSLSVPVTGGVSLAPYVPIALTQAAVAGVSSYAIGQITKTYLANGSSWGPDGPKAVVKSILDSLDETSILHRIREELQAKLEIQPQG